MLNIFIILMLIPFSLSAETSFETRNGITALHSEGMPIARYISENKITHSAGNFDFALIGNIYGTQDWVKRVANEDGWLKVDAVRFEYGAEAKYKLSGRLQIYTRHTMPIDRHNASVGDGWNLHSYRWDSGFIYKASW